MEKSVKEKNMTEPDLIWGLLFFVLLFFFLPEDKPNDYNDNENTEGYSHHCSSYHPNIPHICG